MKSSSLLRVLVLTGCMATLVTGCSRDPNVRKQKYFESGQRYYAEGKYREAIIQFRNATQVDGRFTEAHYELAQAYERVNDWQRAYAELFRVLELDPENYKAHVDMAKLLTSSSQTKEAQEHVDWLLQKHPEEAASHLAAGNVFGREGRYND